MWRRPRRTNLLPASNTSRSWDRIFSSIWARRSASWRPSEMCPTAPSSRSARADLDDGAVGHISEGLHDALRRAQIDEKILSQLRLVFDAGNRFVRRGLRHIALFPFAN